MAGVYTNILGFIVLLGLLSLVVLVYYSKRGNNLLEILLSVTLFISNVGYFFLSTARTVDTAFIANALAYLGGIFLPFIVMLKLVEFSKSKIPDWFTFTMAFFNILLYIIPKCLSACMIASCICRYCLWKGRQPSQHAS